MLDSDARETPPTSRRTFAVQYRVGIIILAGILALSIVWNPFITMFAALSALLLVAAFVWPRETFAGYAVFIIFQDFLLNFTYELPRWGIVFKRVDEIVLLVLLALALTRHQPSKFRPIRPVFLFLLGTLAIGFLSTAVYSDRYLLAGYDVFLLYKGFMVFYIVSQLDLDENHIEKALQILLWIGIVCLAIGVLDFILGDTYRALVNNPRSVEYRRGIPTTVGVFAHAGTAGWFMAFCSCLSLAFWTVKRAPVHLVLTLAFAGSVLLTLRRKPIVGLVAVFIVAVVLTGQKRSRVRTWIAASLLLACFAFAAGDVIVGIFQDLLSQYFYAFDPLDVARNAMHVASVQIAIDHFPLGAGYGRFGGWMAALHYSPLYYEYGLSTIQGLSESRPSYLQDAFWPHVIGELGFIGTFLFVLAMFRMVAPLTRGIVRQTPIIAVVTYAAVFSFIEAIPESLGSVVFEKTVSAGLIFGLLGLAWNARIARDSTVPNR